MDVGKFLERIRQQPFYQGQLAHVEVLPERTGRFARPARPLPDALVELLARRETDRVYEHIQSVPFFAERCENRFNFLVAANVTRKTELSILSETVGQFFDTAFELLVLVGKRDFRAFASEGFCDTRGD